MPRKIVSAEAAARLIRSGQTITTSGFVGCGVPEALLAALGIITFVPDVVLFVPRLLGYGG